MRRLRDAETVFLVYGVLCLLLGSLVINYREQLRYGPQEFQGFVDRNIEFTADFYGLRYHGVSNNYIDAHVLYYGAFEKPVLYWLWDVTRALDDDQLVFVDVGANTGQHTLFMSRFVAQVHAFEPYPTVLARLRHAVEENALSNVSIHPVGLGDRDEQLPFFEPPADNQGAGSFVWNYEDRAPRASRLPVVRGDDYLAARNLSRVDLLKIDVEGYEKHVLAGFTRTLARNRPIVITELSINPAEGRLFGSWQEVASAFPEGYEFSMLADGPLEALSSGDYTVQPVGTIEPAFLFKGQCMLIAFPPEKSYAVPTGPRPANGLPRAYEKHALTASKTLRSLSE